MSRVYVDGKVVLCVDLLRKRHRAWTVYLWLSAIICIIFLAVIKRSLDVLVFLFMFWYVDFKCFAQYSKVNDIDHADACKVTPAKFPGSKEVVPLQMIAISPSLHLAGPNNSTFGERIFYFDFRKQRFFYLREKNTFCKLSFPTKETMDFYLKTSGYGTEAEVAVATEMWGLNLIEYRGPTFSKLLKKQCVQPFFVLQVFCAGIWLLNDYWYYNLFAIIMLFMMESTRAKTCVMMLSVLSRLRPSDQDRAIMVYRCGQWVKLFGTGLFPGDLVSIHTGTGTVPADMLILAGSAIVSEAILNGKHTSLQKVSVRHRGTGKKLSIRRDEAHVLFGGTKILQHLPDMKFHMRTPDGGCLAVVLRTGFQTSRGKLVRTILFSTERVTASCSESGLIILFVVAFALTASVYALKKGLEDAKKLLLSYSMVIACAIPPELAFQLLITVFASLAALKRYGIFNSSYGALERSGIRCYELFRLAFAGKVDICCFDKTGTLTSDDMDLIGVAGLTDSMALEADILQFPARTLQILASCHTLDFVNNKPVGDPLESASLKRINWNYKNGEFVSESGGVSGVKILRTWFFASDLRRMAVVVCVKKQFFVFVKGAPETIQERLVDVPALYVKTYKRHTLEGSIVLALAYKPLPLMTELEAQSLKRDIVENGLTFAGFAVFYCPIRRDSETVLFELKRSSHDVVMITGDQALTACHVAGKVNIVSKPALILCLAKNSEGYEWVSPDESHIKKYRVDEVKALAEANDLCIGGDCIEMLLQTSGILEVIPYVKVFARMTPEQKKLIITTFKSVGRVTLMCGDGTNDCGALKEAHIGVGLPIVNSRVTVQNGYGSSNIIATSMLESVRSNQALISLRNIVYGDASRTSPFQAKFASIEPITALISQGQSILVINRQMWKIIFLRSACLLSMVYVVDVKMDIIHATISGVSAAALYQFSMRARPLSKLSAERPHPNMSTCFFLSLLGQFGVHLLFLISSVREAETYMPREVIEHQNSDLHPDLVSTVSCMWSMMFLLATYTVNYVGHPFNQSISENKQFLYTLVASVVFFSVVISGIFWNLNDWLKLVPLSVALRGKLMIQGFLMFICCYLWERWLRYAFRGKMPDWRKVVAAKRGASEMS